MRITRVRLNFRSELSSIQRDDLSFRSCGMEIFLLLPTEFQALLTRSAECVSGPILDGILDCLIFSISLNLQTSRPISSVTAVKAKLRDFQMEIDLQSKNFDQSESSSRIGPQVCAKDIFSKSGALGIKSYKFRTNRFS